MFDPSKTVPPSPNNRFKYQGNRPRTITVSIPADLHGEFFDEVDKSKLGPSTYAARCIRFALANREGS